NPLVEDLRVLVPVPGHLEAHRHVAPDLGDGGGVGVLGDAAEVVEKADQVVEAARHGLVEVLAEAGLANGVGKDLGGVQLQGFHGIVVPLAILAKGWWWVRPSGATWRPSRRCRGPPARWPGRRGARRRSRRASSSCPRRGRWRSASWARRGPRWRSPG